jgi:hypothetical protein
MKDKTKDITKEITNKKVLNIFEDYLKALSAGENPNLYQLQIKHGYTPASAKGYAVKRTDTWRELVDRIDDESILARFFQIVLTGKDSDSIRAGKELLSLKNRYPKHTKSLDRDIIELFE